MDPFYEALSLFRRRKFDKCADVCTDILEKQPYDQATWCLKMRALVQRVRIDDLEDDDDAIHEEDFLDDHAMAAAPRPGTSMKTAAATAAGNNAISSRPRTSTGRPISGVARPGTQTRPGSALDRLRTARPIGTRCARAIRLGTASMLSQKDGPFLQISRLNIPKYAQNKCVAKPLFEYLFYHEGDVRNAMELAVQATQTCEFNDWYWKVQLAKCYVALNLLRDAEQQLRSAVKQQHHVESFVRLARVYQKLDQPLSAMEILKSALTVFPNDVTTLIELARISESVEDAAVSVKHYRNVIVEDAVNTEAIACIGLYHFYNNQPELALRYYRRVLAIGAHSPELYNNLGLCCLYSQQLDLTYACFQRALDLAIEPAIKAEVWYNLSHLAIAAGDVDLAMQCLNLCLMADPSHAAAFNNLAVVHQKRGACNLAKAYLHTAKGLQPEMPEAKQNLELLLSK